MVRFREKSELRSFQLEVNSDYRAPVADDLEFQPNPLIAHPGITLQNLWLGLARRQLLGACQPQIESSSVERPVRNIHLLGHIRMPGQLVNLIGEPIISRPCACAQGASASSL
jgi:hypothetical protein